MLRIVSHIENLLLGHDCVIVPGIGGFVTHYEEASFSEDGTEIYPPYCSVSFNSQLSDKEDKYGMLAQSYMTAYDINYPRALALVSDDVAALREQLRKNMELQIGTIGTLQLTLNYSLLFTPSEECGIFAKEFYGLVQTAVATDIKIKSDSKAKAVIASAPAEVAQTHQDEVKKPKMHIIERNAENTHYIIRVSKKAVRYTTTTIAAALLYFVFTIAPSINPMRDSNVQEAAIINMPKAKKAKTTAVVSKKTKSDAIEPVAVQQENEQTAYTLVLASAVSKKGAQSLIDELNNDGFTDAQIIVNGKMTRVIYSSYPTNEAAHEAVKQLRPKHERFQSAWVMRK